MTTIWKAGNDTVDLSGISAAGWVRAGLRAVPLLVLVLGGLAVMLMVRLVERPVFGLHRPVTPYITQFVCRTAFRLMGMGFSTRGTQMVTPGAVVANHSAWIDIFSLNAAKRVYFVSKAEVAKWPLIGWLARATGTVFIARDPRQAKAQTEVFEARLKAGHKLLFFPEGTSTDGMRVLPFKSTLFAAFFTPELIDILWVQPVTVNYYAPEGEDERFYGWWGEMDFATHLIKCLAQARPGRVELIYHTPLKVSESGGRKQLAAACERIVRADHHMAGRTTG